MIPPSSVLGAGHRSPPDLNHQRGIRRQRTDRIDRMRCGFLAGTRRSRRSSRNARTSGWLPRESVPSSAFSSRLASRDDRGRAVPWVSDESLAAVLPLERQAATRSFAAMPRCVLATECRSGADARVGRARVSNAEFGPASGRRARCPRRSWNEPRVAWRVQPARRMCSSAASNPHYRLVAQDVAPDRLIDRRADALCAVPSFGCVLVETARHARPAALV